MERKTFTFNGVTFSYIDNMPDGDYTVGRGADPRGKPPVEGPTKTGHSTVSRNARSKPASPLTDKAAARPRRRAAASSAK